MWPFKRSGKPVKRRFKIQSNKPSVDRHQGTSASRSVRLYAAGFESGAYGNMGDLGPGLVELPVVAPDIASRFVPTQYVEVTIKFLKGKK